MSSKLNYRELKQFVFQGTLSTSTVARQLDALLDKDEQLQQVTKERDEAVIAITMIKNLIESAATTTTRLTAIGIECDNFLKKLEK